MRIERLYVVRWRDAHGVRGEDVHDDVMRVHKPAIYWSAGVLVESDSVGVTIAQDYGLSLDREEPTYRTRTFIPRDLIDDEFDCGVLIRTRRKKKQAPLAKAEEIAS